MDSTWSQEFSSSLCWLALYVNVCWPSTNCIILVKRNHAISRILNLSWVPEQWGTVSPSPSLRRCVPTQDTWATHTECAGWAWQLQNKKIMHIVYSSFWFCPAMWRRTQAQVGHQCTLVQFANVEWTGLIKLSHVMIVMCGSTSHVRVWTLRHIPM